MERRLVSASRESVAGSAAGAQIRPRPRRSPQAAPPSEAASTSASRRPTTLMPVLRRFTVISASGRAAAAATSSDGVRQCQGPLCRPRRVTSRGWMIERRCRSRCCNEALVGVTSEAADHLWPGWDAGESDGKGKYAEVSADIGITGATTSGVIRSLRRSCVVYREVACRAVAIGPSPQAPADSRRKRPRRPRCRCFCRWL